ncbi:type II secretion system secretin GspD [Anaeromyxobacter oryzae]|uniref:Type II secretion system protein GspD n=1 Tax=Anaeromyxobacter oryzae TaxID=2918170 RepID=A0ABM7WXT8_9BACT|nr:type II secretion system secretin GspD [Anaeromyxobacter oryzae]BDG04343.1 type II secretion system protein GspD [Anaeromyxobacter oryzae]
MKTLLAAFLLAPAIALAQVPLRPPGPQPQPQPQRPMVRPTTPVAPPQGGAPTSPTAPGARPGGAAPATQRPATQPGEGTVRATDQKCVPLQGRFMLTFNKADIVDVLEQASRWTCRNFVYTEDVARGKITLLSKTPVTADEAYAAFLAALNANNIAVYATGRYYKLIRNADAKKNPIPTYTGADAGTPANEQPLTKIIKLQYADADQLRGILGNFISPQGADIQSIPPDTLVITDIGLNLRRLEKIIDAVDKAGAGDMVRIVQIRYASAKDIADKLNQIFQAQGGAPGRKTRAMLSAPGAAPGPVRPGPVVTPAPAPGGGPVEVSVSKILPDDRTNKLVIIADDKSFQRIMDLIEQLDVPTSADGGIHVVFLKNANAEDLAQTLSNLAQGQAKKPGAPGAAPGAMRPGVVPGQPAPAAPAAPGVETAELFAGEVKITADKTQNALLIQASGSDFASIQRLIDKLDRPRRQVFVEAVIMEVNLRDQLHFGVGAHAATTFKYKGENGVLPIASEPGSVSSLNLSNVVSLGGFLTGFVGPVSAELKDLGLNLPSIGVLVQALQSNSDVNVLSTPHIVATDNEDSEITVGQNVPFQAGFAPQGLSNLLSGGTTTAGTQTAVGSALGLGGLSSLYAPIQRQNVELRLKIKPQINEGGNVRLTIEEQTEEIASSDPQLGPTTAKRSVKTQIVAKDQSTIVLGGMYQERNLKSVSKIPFLGSLPVIGWLFRDTTTTKQKTNLLLFLTPYIIRDESDYRRIYEKKRKEQQEFMEQFYGRQSGFQVDVDFSRKAGPYSRLHRGVEEESRKLENGGRGLPGEGVTTPPGAPRPGEAPAGQPPLSPRPPASPAPDEGTPVDRLEVQPDVPEPGTPPPARPPAEPQPQPPGAQQPTQ